MKVMRIYPSSIIQIGLASILLVLQALLLKPASVIALTYTREDFPSNFIFGSGTSAYQVEGAAFEDGRTPSVVDMLFHDANFSDFNGDNGDVACDGYHKYKEDVQLMVDLGLDAYRFSISWSRLIPNGRGPINPKGLEYYNNLINELLDHGIQPHVTLLHFDSPQALEDDYGGWKSQDIVKDFTTYADVCFREFGDRVKYWTPINEPNCFATYFNSLPYMVSHNFLLGHASVVKLYKQKYQASQQGSIGMAICASWNFPATNTINDLLATKRVNDFTFGWFIHPIVFGDYPDTMKHSLGSQLPSFTNQESKLLRGSFDFIGVNTYNGVAIKDDPSKHGMSAKCHIIDDTGGKFMEEVLKYFKQVYGNPPIFVYENGLRTPRSASLNDTSRVKFLSDCIGSLLNATRNGSNVKGYFEWSLLDLFEVPGGYKVGLGLYYVDLDDLNLRRYPKLSAYWYSAFLKGERLMSSSELKTARSSELLEQSRRQLLQRDDNIKMSLMKVEDISGFNSPCVCAINK